MARERETP